MKRNIEQIRGWLQMMKAPYWEIFYGTSKFPSYTFMSEGGTIEDSLAQFDTVVNSLAIGDYTIRSRRKISDTGNSVIREEFTIPSQMNQPNAPANNLGHVSSLEKLYQERMENALELQKKEFELNSIKRDILDLKEEFNKLKKSIIEFEDWVRDSMDLMDDGKVNNSMQSMVKDGVSSLVETGTKQAFDRFANMKKSS